MLLEDDLVSSINGEKDALQPCMKALMDHTLFDVGLLVGEHAPKSCPVHRRAL